MSANVRYAEALGRAFAGAVIFALPLLMTMEMWWLGFYLDRARLVQFVVFDLLVLVGLSRVSGFEPTESLFEDLLDAFAAFAVAIVAAAAILLAFGIIDSSMPASEIVGKITIQAVPASFGAMLASKQLGTPDEGVEESRRSGYGAQLFLMMAGAMFLGYNVAPTEEMVLLSLRMTGWHSIATVLVSIALLHALVYTVGFQGQEQPGEGRGFVHVFVRFTIAGYGIAILVSLYVLWTFGRTDGASLPQIASMVAVLGFPSAIGAAIARLVV